MVIVPVFPGEVLYKERVRLDGRDYVLRFDWSKREERFYLSIADQDEVSLIAGLRVLPNRAMLIDHHDPRLPRGMLIPIDLELNGLPPARGEFGTRVKLYHFAPGDLT